MKLQAGKIKKKKPGSGAKQAAAAPPPPGTVEVTAVAASDGSAVAGATVKAGAVTATTSAAGTAVLQLPPGSHKIAVEKHDAALDHVTFVVHYPEWTRSHEAKTSRTAGAAVKSGQVSQVKVELEVLELLNEVILHRRHIDFGGSDKYGHWWTVIDGSESFGWWPKYPLGSPANNVTTPPTPPPALPADAGIADRIQHMASEAAHSAQNAYQRVRESGPIQTLAGVEGELNGRTSFGGKAKRYGDSSNLDPHHLGGDTGNVRYQPVIKKGDDMAALKDRMRSFADGYAGGWSWRFEGGNHCHTFQKQMMNACALERFKRK